MSFNQQIIVGHTGADPEFSVMPSGKPVCNLSVATSKKWTDESGNKQEKTTWHRLVLFGRLAEIARDYTRKGSQIMAVGETDHQKYKDKNTGQDRYSTQIIARELQLLGGRGDGNSQQQAPLPANAGKPAGGAPAAAEFDDDIPF